MPEKRKYNKVSAVKMREIIMELLINSPDGKTNFQELRGVLKGKAGWRELQASLSILSKDGLIRCVSGARGDYQFIFLMGREPKITPNRSKLNSRPFDFAKSMGSVMSKIDLSRETKPCTSHIREGYNNGFGQDINTAR